MRLLVVALLLVLLVIVPFVIWGDQFGLLLDGDAAIDWLRAFGVFSALIGVLLLIADLFLPLPASGVMAALGVLFGPIAGGALAALGNFLSGILAFGLCRFFGQPALTRLIGSEAVKKDASRLQSTSFLAVAGSRALPVLPEVTACMAGLYGMKWRRFILALALGALVTGFGFASMGHFGRDDPTFAIILATLLPPVLLLIVTRFR